ncbi:MAG: tRNA glutamyl-Q(34) synthetase GluQRS [Alphaproteobacteria bacterium]|jgi:glutamyl-Q tRNA(Asp) synthetase|nr:tRNA glutamyl-Q(34) synthetase GluQRS [Alphaproteobacteria bacterium]MDP6815447.1 tRNA glutamyl-Q(34) synthetase GluQRS [Alphaproteobacteria bacterium]
MPHTATVTRFAPSPTGLLHLGNAYSALYCERAARRRGGRFLVRIEDIDRGRCRPEHETAMLQDLAWLGLDWETPVRRQSEHMADYAAALDRLAALGVSYPCFCTRKQIIREIAASPSAPHGPDGPIYPGTCRRLSAAEREERIAAGQAFAVRLDVEAAATRVGPGLSWTDRQAGLQTLNAGLHGDVVLARKDTPTSYHLAVTVDDARQGITLVTRGLDLFPSSHVHRLLQALLELPTPAYEHHRLLRDDAGLRLSKGGQAIGIRRLREDGIDAAEIRRRLGFDGSD